MNEHRGNFLLAVHRRSSAGAGSTEGVCCTDGTAARTVTARPAVSAASRRKDALITQTTLPGPVIVHV